MSGGVEKYQVQCHKGRKFFGAGRFTDLQEALRAAADLRKVFTHHNEERLLWKRLKP